MRIVFLSGMCALDTRSGAAREMRTLLEWLAAAGWEAHSVSASLFDGTEEFPLAAVVGSEAADPANRGKVLELERAGVQHHILYLASSHGRNATRAETRRLEEVAAEQLRRIQPDVVISYGRNHAVNRSLWASARAHAGRLVFYLANGRYDDAETFAPFDRVLCPSGFLADLYRQRLGIDPGVLPTMIETDSFAPPQEVAPAANIATRGAGLVTFVNPSLEKGGALFLRLARMAGAQRPDLTFLCVEGRMSAADWRGRGVDLAGEPNVWWLPNQRDMPAVLRRTSVLLFPSFGPEAAGRVITEAQLGGIPVLGANRGGVPEQMNGGGFLFDIPGECIDNHSKIPPAEAVQPWLHRLARLMDDDAAYSEAVHRAREAAVPWQPERRRQEVVAAFEAFATEGTWG